jgi:hypothetical protein
LSCTGSIALTAPPFVSMADGRLRIKLFDADLSANLRKEISQHLQYLESAPSEPKTLVRIGLMNLGANASGCR